MIEFYIKKTNATIKRNDTFTNKNIKKWQRKMDKLYVPIVTFSNPRNFSTFLLAFLFYFQSEHRWTVKNKRA